MGKLDRSSVGLTKEVLTAFGTGAFIVAAVAIPGIGYLFREIKREQLEQANKKGRLVSTLRRLERQKYLTWKEENGEKTLVLSEKGQKKLLKFDSAKMTLKKSAKWDGKFRIVIFDIPEAQAKARKIFREKLKEMEFHPLQKSVFVTPFECRDEIDFLRHELDIANYVHYVLAHEISNIDLKVWFRRD